MLGCTATALVGCPLDGVVQDGAPIRTLLAQAARGVPSQCEQVFPRAAGKAHSLSLIALPILDPQESTASTLVTLARCSAVSSIENASAASKEQFRAPCELFDEGVSTLEVQFDESDQAIDYRFLNVNEAHQAMTGLGAEVIGKYISEVMPDMDPSVLQQIGQVARAGEPIRFEKYIRTLDCWFDIYLSRVGGQESRAVVSVFRNITERKKRERLQAFLLTLSDALRPLVDPQEILVLAADLLGEHLRVNQANYGEVRGEYVHVSHSYVNGLVPMVGSFNADDFGKRLIEGHRAGRLQVCMNTTTDPLFDLQEREALAAAHVGAYIAVPLIKQGVWVGVLSVMNILPRGWTSTEIEAVQEVAERTWAAVERIRAEGALMKSEEKYRALFNSIDEGFTTLEILFDERGKAIDAIHLEMNPAYGRQSGASRELLGKRLREVIPTLEDRIFERYGRVALTGESERFEEHVALWDYWFDAFATRVGGEGSHIVAVIFNNITERKRRESHANFLEKLSGTLPLLDNPGEIVRATGEALGTHLDVGFLNIVDVQLDYGADPAEARFTVVAAWEREGLPSPRGTYRAGDYLSDEFLRAARAGEPVVIRDTDTDPRVDRAAYRAIGLRAYVAVPILKDGAWPGLITVFTPGPRDWRPDEVTLIIDVAHRLFLLCERVRAKMALRESEARLQALIENLPGGAVFVVDRELRYQIAEGEAIADAGHKSVDFLGKLVREALPENLASVYESFYRKALAGEHFEHEHEVHGRAYLTRGVPLYSSSGQIYAVLAASFDITERKRAEADLRDVARRKDEFLAMLAHELRNPLAAISSATQVMKHATTDNASVQRPREVIERQMQHLTRLVDDLLDMSRLTWGKINLKHETLSLAAVLSSAVEASRPLIDARRHHLAIMLPPSAAQVAGDPTRLVQVFGNLLNNAAKYTEPGGHIALHTVIENGEAIVYIRDNGCGLSASLLPHVFELFTQEGRSLDRSQGGLGVGLALVCSLVTMHGGSVKAYSKGLGRGSEFVVRLPLTGDGNSFELPTTNIGAAPTSALSPRMKVLVVEDNADAAEMLAMLLRGGGDDVRVAHDGLVALDQARDFQPQVVLCDIGLPSLSGYMVATRLREQPEYRETLLIALSGYGRDEDRDQSKVAGFDHHLTKPVDPEFLAALLQQRRLVKM